MNEIYQIYDKAFKRILTLSEKTVINLINGLFDTDYPTNSKITYNWTEHEDKDLKRTLADSILTINGRDSYHIEAQMTEDEEIVFRFIEYGFGHAYKNRRFIDGGERMVFPRPCILYLDEGKKDKLPDEYTLIMQFENQGEFAYKVPVVKLQNISAEELNNKKLIALLPFQLLKLRKKLEKLRTKENLEELQKIVTDDIMMTIERNVEVGNISPTDALDLIEITTKLYMKIYSKYEELEEFTMRMCDQSMELISDKYEKTVEDLQDEITLTRDKYKQRISGMQDEIANTRSKYEQRIEGLQDEITVTRDRYEQKIEGLQDEITVTRDNYEQKIEGLQDEITVTRDNYEQKISGMQDEIASTRSKYEQKIEGMQDEMANTRDRYEKKVSGMQDEIASTRSKYEQKISGMQDEIANTCSKYEQKIEGMQDEISNTRDKYEKKIEGLQDEMSLTRNKYEEKVKNMRDEIALTIDKYEKAELENRELKDEVAGMKDTMNNMESVIDELRTTISRLEKQLQVQQEK